jgi:hypothetical protein
VTGWKIFGQYLPSLNGIAVILPPAAESWLQDGSGLGWVPPDGSQVNTTLLADCGVAWATVTVSSSTERALVVVSVVSTTEVVPSGRSALAAEAVAGSSAALMANAAPSKL